ncbi:unnamed protein product, partial [Didymodactylos carnosus]
NPLRVLCQRIASPGDLNKLFLDGHLKRARFYRWAKTMKNYVT